MTKHRRPQGQTDKGNIFLAIFGAVAVVGVLGAAVMTFSNGPIQNALNVNRKNASQVDMSMVGQMAIMSATNASNQGDCDSDGYVEPPEWRLASSIPAPTGGGLIPNTIGTSKRDPWGTQYGYCVWDDGPVRLNSACRGTVGVDKRLNGADTKKYPVMAIISAGPDKTFTTTCRSFTTADVNGDGDLEDASDMPLVSKTATTDDDIIFTYSYNDAMATSGGMWSLKSTDTNTATINKNIEATSGSFSGVGTFQRLAAVGADYLDVLNGLKLASSASMPTCNSSNLGVLRRASSGYAIEICNGSAWSSMGGSATNMDGLSDAISNNNNLFAGYLAGNETNTGSNTIFGIDSGSSITTSPGSTLMGYQAGKSTMTQSLTAMGWGASKSLTGGASNTIIGYEAGSTGTGFFSTTAIGYQAAKSVGSSAGHNTAVGAMAMLMNTNGTKNTAVGFEAMKSITGSENLAIGYQAMLYTTSGSYNTFIGWQAGTGIGTQNYNTAVGPYALKDMTTADSNVAIGSAAGWKNTTGARNTVVGTNALSNNVTGNNNVALGDQALQYPQTDSNTAVGKDALQSQAGSTFTNMTAIGTSSGISCNAGSDNTTVGANTMTSWNAVGIKCDANTAIGSGSLQSYNSTTAMNTVVGYNALNNGTGSIGNVAMGYESLYSLSSAAYNTAVGYRAGRAITTGSQNTAVGYQALLLGTLGPNTAIGRSAGAALTTANSSTYIGSWAGAASTASTNTGIGYQALKGVSGSSGSQNVAIGVNSMVNVGVGANNVCIGNLTCAAPGGGNVAIGYQAFTAPAGAPSNNTAVGYQALYDNRTNGAVGIGYQAGYTQNSGTKNSYFGYLAGTYSNGSENTMFGWATGQGDHGNYNTIVGAYSNPAWNAAMAGNTTVGAVALRDITTSNNTALGNGAGQESTTGGNNTMLGWYSFSQDGTSPINSISNATSIGTYAIATDGLSNVTAMGYNALVTANNSIRAGNTSMTTIAGQVAFTATSDKRVKKDIHPTDLGLDFIMKLKPVSYRLIDGNGRIDYGFLAQDVEIALDGRKTNMVTRDNDKMHTYRLRADDIISPLVRAVQEQQAELESLEKEVDSIH